MRAYLNLRFTVPERRRIFAAGLTRLGYEVVYGVTMTPGPRDILCTWNRIGEGANAARAFEAASQPVIVAENASWGNQFAGGAWYHMTRNQHNQSGRFPVGGHLRWDSLNVELAPWRTSGETVILPSRGFGGSEHRMPREWPMMQKGRLRPHPGTGPCVLLREDLARAGKVITWGSGAAIQAIMWGIPCESHMPGWIGSCLPTDESRLTMLRRLAWAQHRVSEIEDGSAFARLLPR